MAAVLVKLNLETAGAKHEQLQGKTSEDGYIEQRGDLGNTNKMLTGPS